MTPWTVAHQAPLSMGILQARITGVDFHALSMTQGLNFGLLHWQVDSLPLSQQGSPGNLGMFGQMWCNSKFIIQVVFYMNANFLSSYCESESHSVVSNSLWPHGILQARILEWVAIPFSRESSQPRDRTQVSLTAGGILYQLSHQGSLSSYYVPAVTWTTFINLNNSVIGVLL